MTEGESETAETVFPPEETDYLAEPEAVAASARLQQAFGEIDAQPPAAPVDVLESHFQVRASDLHDGALATRLFATSSETADNLLIQVELFATQFRTQFHLPFGDLLFLRATEISARVWQ